MKEYKEKYNKMLNELSELKKEEDNCLRGYLRKRVINGREYYYLQYRDGKHVRSSYVRPEKAGELLLETEKRKDLEQKVKALKLRLKKYERLLGIHRSYRPVKNVDYKEYTLFMSGVAHDFKRMSADDFIEKYDTSKYRGINKRYLSGFLDYVFKIDRKNARKTNDLILDPYTYLMYYKYGHKEILEEELKRSIPEFLCRGLLVTDVQVAVNGEHNE